MSVRAWAWDVDGKPAAVAGYYLKNGQAVVFSDMIEGAPKIRIWREAKVFMEGIALPAVCEATRGSERFLERLGWVHMQTTDECEVYRWPY